MRTVLYGETRSDDGPSDHDTLLGLDDGRDVERCADYSRILFNNYVDDDIFTL